MGRAVHLMELRGFCFATPDEVMADPAFSLPHELVGRYGGGLWQRLRHERRREQARAPVEALLREQAAAWDARGPGRVRLQVRGRRAL